MVVERVGRSAIHGAEEAGTLALQLWAVLLTLPRIMPFAASRRRWRAAAVRSRSVFASVSGADSHVATDFVLNGTIERLEEVDDDRRVAAVCALSAQLRDTRTGSVVWTNTITERVHLEQRDVAGLVNGLTTPVRNSVDRLVADLELELGRSAALPCVDPRTCVATHPR
jgi:hypothetical protein